MSIDIVYYINLDHRIDRKEQILKELNNMEFKNIQRTSAVYDKRDSWHGCAWSHYLTLKKFCASNYNNCIIFEDDFYFHDYEYSKKMLSEFLNSVKKWDVVFLSCNYKYLKKKSKHETEYSYLRKILFNHSSWGKTTAGYMINKQFAQTLMENFKECVEKKLVVDNNWNKLQHDKNYDWYVFHPKLGSQRVGFSDIERKVMDYSNKLK